MYIIEIVENVPCLFYKFLVYTVFFLFVFTVPNVRNQPFLSCNMLYIYAFCFYCGIHSQQWTQYSLSKYISAANSFMQYALYNTVSSSYQSEHFLHNKVQYINLSYMAHLGFPYSVANLSSGIIMKNLTFLVSAINLY